MRNQDASPHRYKTYREQPTVGAEEEEWQVPLLQHGLPKQVPFARQHDVPGQLPPPDVVAHPENSQTKQATARAWDFFSMGEV